MTNPTATPSAPAVTDPVGQTLQKLLKPGAKTTEFITMVAVYAGALATLLGAFNTSSSRFNAILKVAALAAAAVSQVGYALSRGDTKAALGSLVSALAKNGVIRPAVKPEASSADAQGGAASLGALGAVLLVLGALVAVLSSGAVAFLVIGIVVAVIGFVLLLNGGITIGGRRPL